MPTARRRWQRSAVVVVAYTRQDQRVWALDQRSTVTFLGSARAHTVQQRCAGAWRTLGSTAWSSRSPAAGRWASRRTPRRGRLEAHEALMAARLRLRGRPHARPPAGPHGATCGRVLRLRSEPLGAATRAPASASARPFAPIAAVQRQPGRVRGRRLLGGRRRGDRGRRRPGAPHPSRLAGRPGEGPAPREPRHARRAPHLVGPARRGLARRRAARDQGRRCARSR